MPDMRKLKSTAQTKKKTTPRGKSLKTNAGTATKKQTPPVKRKRGRPPKGKARKVESKTMTTKARGVVKRPPRNEAKKNFPIAKKTLRGKSYQIRIDLDVLMTPIEVAAQQGRVETIESVLDGNGSEYRSGVVCVFLREPDGAERTVTNGIDAEDVELLLKLFGVVE